VLSTQAGTGGLDDSLWSELTEFYFNAIQVGISDNINYLVVFIERKTHR